MYVLAAQQVVLVHDMTAVRMHALPTAQTRLKPLKTRLPCDGRRCGQTRVGVVSDAA